jgi:murein DD-endopeptidase MepM/ murein hydrolase activator NlpD
VWRRAVTLLCLVAVLSPAAAGLAADPEKRLDDVKERLDDAKTDLRGVERRKAVQLADLQVIDARRAKLERELAVLNERLSAAEAELADSENALFTTTQRLVATQTDLDQTRTELVQQQEMLDNRTRATYMYGARPAWAGLIFGADSVNDFGRGLKYAQTMLAEDQRRVERISGLEAKIERTAADLRILQDRRAEQRAADAQRRDAAAAIVAEREAVAAKLDAEADKRRLLVAQLESDRRSYVAMVQELKSQSDQLQERLAAIAAAERARAEAERQAAIQENVPVPSVVAPAPSGELLWPASGPKTSDYGWRTHPIFGTQRFHAGIDIGAGYGAAILAAASGVVVSAGEMGGYGYATVIDHGGGLATLYAHQSSMQVSAGQSVSRGQVIGAVGSTGYSTGPHLHFEVRVNGATRDPMAYF